MIEQIVIWGSGAIGGTIGAHLRRAGHNVLFVDTNERHLQEIAAGRLKVDSPDGRFFCKGEAKLPTEMSGRQKLIFLAVKSQHTEAAMYELLPFLDDDGLVISCQNGLNEPVIASIVGAHRTIGCLVNFGADYLAPGHIWYRLRGAIVVGELDGAITSRLKAVHSILQSFEPGAKLSNNIFGFLWGRNAYEAILTCASLSNETLAKVLADPTRRSLLIAVAQEVLRVSVALGFAPASFDGFEPGKFLENDEAAIAATFARMINLSLNSGRPQTNLWRDIVLRQSSTEVAVQAVPVQQAARKYGLTTPLYDRLVSLIGECEAGRRSLGPDLVVELLSLLPSAADARRPAFIGNQ